MKAFAFTGRSGSGKTTLIERLVARFAEQGLQVSTVKHAHHGFDMDTPGKDSWRFRQAGAQQVLVASARRWALLTECAQEAPGLEPMLARLDPCDLVLVEGFRGQGALPSIHVHRYAPGREDFTRPDDGACAVATNAPEELRSLLAPMPVLDLDDVDGVARFVQSILGRNEEPPGRRGGTA